MSAASVMLGLLNKMNYTVVLCVFAFFLQGPASLVQLACQPVSTVINPWASNVNWTVYTGTSHHPIHRHVSVRPATLVMPAMLNVHSMAHVSIIVACVCMDSVATRASYLTVQVRTV